MGVTLFLQTEVNRIYVCVSRQFYSHYISMAFYRNFLICDRRSPVCVQSSIWIGKSESLIHICDIYTWFVELISGRKVKMNTPHYDITSLSGSIPYMHHCRPGEKGSSLHERWFVSSDYIIFFILLLTMFSHIQTSRHEVFTRHCYLCKQAG